MSSKDRSILQYIGNQPFMVVLRGFMASSINGSHPTPRHIRGLATQYSLSVSGVSDIIRRLNSLGVLKETKIKNKKYFTLNLSKEEEECLHSLFDLYTKQTLLTRAQRYSKGALEKLIAMDEMYSFYRSVKEND